MSYWNYQKVGASAKQENIRHVAKIFEYIGYYPKTEYNDYEECSFEEPDVYCTEHSNNILFSGNIRKEFENMWHEDLLDLLNALFTKTDVYVHYAEGNDTSDTWENESFVYDTGNMTGYFDGSYTSYDGGLNGKKSYKFRFALKPPKMEYVNALVDLSIADGNEELTALLQEVSRKLREGLIVYSEDTTDTRVIGKIYDVVDNVTGEED